MEPPACPAVASGPTARVSGGNVTPVNGRLHSGYRGHSCLRLLLSVVCCLLSLAPPAHAAYKSRIAFSGYDRSAPVTNFPALVELSTNITEFAYNNFLSTNGYDLRFYDSTGLTNLVYEIEKWITGGVSYVWVLIPELSSNTYIWAQWGDVSQSTRPATSTNGTVWASGYSGVWHMTETNAQDSTSNGRHGTSQGNVDTDGFIAGGQSFTRTETDYIALPHFDSATPMTISAWVKVPGAATERDIVGWTTLEQFAVNANGKLAHTALGGGTLPESPSAIDDNQWHHVAFVRVADNDTALYIDGQRVATGTLPRDTSTSALSIGAAGAGTNPFDGLMDEVRISSVARSSNWLWAAWMTQASNSTFVVYSNVLQVLPWVETFEQSPTTMAGTLGALNGQHGWVTLPTNLVSVQDTNAYNGAQAGLCESNAVAHREFRDTSSQDVWVDCYARPPWRNKSGFPSPNPNTAAAFYLNSNGNVIALTGTNWVTNTVYSATEGAWMRFTAHLDYASSNWSLYVSDTTPNALAVNVFRNINFQPTATNTSIRKFKVTGSATPSHLDDIAIAGTGTHGMPRNIDDDGDGLSDRWEIEYLGATNVTSGGTTDTDGDGYTDVQEYMAGTHPNNITSFFGVSSADLDTESSSTIKVSLQGGGYSATSVYAGDTIRRTFRLNVAANDFNGTRSTELTISDTLTGAWTWYDNNAVNLYTSRFYNVSLDYAGTLWTNTIEEWAMFVQDRVSDEKDLICVPANYNFYGVNQNNLNSSLGRHLARGLYANTDPNVADSIEWLNSDGGWEVVYLHTNATSNAWYSADTLTATNMTVTPGMAFWVKRGTNSPNTRSNTVFIAKSYKESNIGTFSFTTNYGGWTMFGWALPAAIHHENTEAQAQWSTPTNQLGFVAAGGVGGSSINPSKPDNWGDSIWEWIDNTWKERYWLLNNGQTDPTSMNWNHKWYDARGGFADFYLQPGEAYYYYHSTNKNGTVFTWTPEYNP